jgi:hypothetical protein
MNLVKWVFRLGAISNFLVTAHAIIDPVGNWSTVPRLEALLPTYWQMSVAPLNYPSFVIIWSGMAFLWGVMMWEISTDPVRHHAMIKYTYIEKCITTYAITWGTFWHGGMPTSVFLLILYTDVLWIVLFIIAHSKVRTQLGVPA